MVSDNFTESMLPLPGPAIVPPALTEPANTPPPFTAAAYASDGKAHLLLACTGSVATIKLPSMLAALAPISHRLSVRVLLTAHACAFLAGQSAEQPQYQSLPTLYPDLVAGVHVDADEWAPAWTRGAPVLHIELRRWADLLVVAPLSADALAKMVGGICDDLLGCVLRAWDVRGTTRAGRRKRVLVAPAMNTAMWLHPVTERQVRVLEEEWGWSGEDGKGWVEVLRPVEKALACGDVGAGAMRDWGEIVEAIETRLPLEEY